MKSAARHLEFERIISAAENFPATFSVDEEKHLENCSKCSTQLKKLTNLRSLAPNDLRETVPQAATAHLLNIYRRPAAQPANPSAANRLAALLVFDDWKPEFALHERLSFQDTRQFIYRAGVYNIDLRVTFTDDKLLTSGQLFSENLTAVVRIFNANFSVETNLNEYGEFNFPPVEQSIFNLQIVLENETIEINDVSFS